jgi:hypothetical protein
MHRHALKFYWVAVEVYFYLNTLLYVDRLRSIDKKYDGNGLTFVIPCLQGTNPCPLASITITRRETPLAVGGRMRAFIMLSIPAVAVACSGSHPSSDAPSSSGVSEAIINGTLDTTHQAVVAIEAAPINSVFGLCSGTIIKVDPVSQIGWVLTAAHCISDPPVVVVQGNDFNGSDVVRYPVVSYKADPAYDAKAVLHDFAIIRIGGVDASTPVIAMTGDPDGIANAGTSVVALGYGQTTLDGANNNSARYQIAMFATPDPENPTARIQYDQRTGGICFGDSGGPDLLITNGVEQVVGVHSYVSGINTDCNETGNSGRVTYDLSFINGEIANSQPEPEDGGADAVDGGQEDGGTDSYAADGGSAIDDGVGTRAIGSPDAALGVPHGSGCSASARGPSSHGALPLLSAVGLIIGAVAHRRRR